MIKKLAKHQNMISQGQARSKINLISRAASKKVMISTAGEVENESTIQ